MYRILVVDDEPIHRREMANIIRTLRNDYEVVEASNGINALETLNNGEFNILITDVKMPLMDGLQLIEALGEQAKKIKVVILSGYDYFDYAKRALKLGACDYLLKPIDEDTIEAMLKRVEELLEIQMAGERNRKKLQEQLNIAYPLYVDNTMNKWIREELNKDEIEKLGIIFQSEGYCRFFLIQAFGSETDICNLDVNTNNGIKPYLRNIVINHLGQFGNILSFFVEGKRLIIAGIIISSKREDDHYKNRLEHQIKQLAATVCDKRQFRIKAGISSSHSCMSCKFDDSGKEVYRKAYIEAVNALEYGFYKARTVNFYSADETILNTDTLAIDNSLETKMKDAVRNNDRNMAGEIVRNELRRIIENGKLPYDLLLSYSENLLLTFLNLIIFTVGKTQCDELTLKIEQMLANCVDYLELVRTSENLVEEIFETVGDISKDRSCYIIQKCVDYIYGHLDEELNVKVLADKFHFNASYFSTIFKKNMGKGLSDYITDIRMEKAAQLLKQSDEKIYTIAKRVGFCDVKYFYKIFRKKFGVTPSHYRKFLEVSIGEKQGVLEDEGKFVLHK